MVNLTNGSSTGTISTPFNDLYTADGTYDIRVRYFDDSSVTNAVFSLKVNGVQQGVSWSGTNNDDSWRVRTIPNVALVRGDEITLENAAASGDLAEIDYVELVLR